jgi:hypothetical protein
VAWSADMRKAFEKYLKDKGLTGLFKIKQAGVKHTPAEYKEPRSVLLARWRRFMREADLVVALGSVLYKTAKFKIPSGVKPFYTIEYGVQPEKEVFDAILEKVGKKFELVVPEKKK